jgi:hypothetical protein
MVMLAAAPGGQRAAEANNKNENAASRFTKTVKIESFIGIGVLLAAAFLTITSPPAQEHHQAGSPDAGLVQTATIDNTEVTFNISPFQVGVNTFRVSLVNEAGAAPTNILNVLLWFKNTVAGVGPIITTLENVEDGSYSITGAYLSQPGTWKIDFIAQRSDAYDLNYDFEETLTVAPTSGEEGHSGHEQATEEETSSPDSTSTEEAAIPPSENFTIAAIILSIGVAAGSGYSVIRSRQQLKRTAASLDASG